MSSTIELATLTKIAHNHPNGSIARSHVETDSNLGSNSTIM
jgi:hypothetical protein